jgi:DnaJ-class molecular chaperone
MTHNNPTRECRRCEGTGNELLSLYRRCEACGGSGRLREDSDRDNEAEA